MTSLRILADWRARCGRRCAVVVLVGVLLLPLSAGAQIGGGGGGITNPIGCKEIGECIQKVVQYVLGIAGILALAGIVYGGFLYITAAGNQDRIEAGKNAVTYSVIGLVVIGFAYAIITFIFQALGGGGGGGPGFGGGPGGGGPGFGGGPGGGPGFGGGP